MVTAGGGCCGFAAAGRLRRQERELKSLSAALERMNWELSCLQSSASELMRAGAKAAHGAVAELLLNAAQMMEAQLLPDATACICAAAKRHMVLEQTAELFEILGASFGKYDLDGQRAALQSVSCACSRALASHCDGMDSRMRSYRILGLCAGGALAILLI